jgi:protein O-GlcNAc transferase
MQSPADQFIQAVRLQQAGDLSGAERLYRDLLRIDPLHADALSNLGAILVRRSQFEEAIDCYRAAIQINPRHTGALFNLGNVYRRLSRLDAAAESYQTLANMPQPPKGLFYNLGLTLLGLGRCGEAETAFCTALRAEPDNPEFLHHLGLVVARLGRLDEAIAALERAVQIRPDFAEALTTLGVMLENAGQAGRAFACYRQALAIQPDQPEANNNIGNSLTEQGAIDEAVGHFRRSLAARPDQPHVHSNMLLTLHYHPGIGPEALSAEHWHWAERFAPTTPPSPEPEDSAPDRVLRIGFVSADFRTHTVAAFIEPILTHLDRTAVHVSCFSNVIRSDAVTDRFKALADGWHPIIGVPDEAVAQLIRRERIDIFVDLSGHTAGNRLLLFARRPAPIQVTHFGYPDTTGLGAIDCRITDARADPPGTTERWHSERLVRLPEVAWCYRPPADAPEVSEPPAGAANPITLLSVNNPAKLTADVIAVWSRILDAVPGSKLVVLAGREGSALQRVEDLFANHGIVGSRLKLVPRLPPTEYFALFATADLALDPWPYNGGVTTCDALWMGVPVISMAGRTYVSRQGVSLLHAVGLPELIADSPEGYVEIARQWAADRDRLKAVRADLRGRMRASPLTDSIRFTRHLEAAYRRMWHWRVGAGPAP